MQAPGWRRIGQVETGVRRVRDREVRPLAVGRRPPLHPAVQAARAGAVLPNDLSLVVRVERPPDPRLLADDDQVAAVGQRFKDRRVAEIEVGAGIFRTHRRRGPLQAGGPEDIRRQELHGPLVRAVAQVEGDDRVARLALRAGVLVARRRVEHAARGVDRRRVPDCRPGRAPSLRAGRRRSDWRRFVQGVRLPDHAAGGGVQRDDAAAEPAALVARNQPRTLFQRRHRYVQPVLEQRGRAGDPRHRVLVDAPAPQRLARIGVNGVHGPGHVAEVRRVADVVRRHADRGPDGRAGGEDPVRAPGHGVEGIDVAVRAADEEAPARDHRLRPRLRRLRESERPLERQARHVGRGQTGLIRRLEARVAHRDAPAVPAGRRGRIR